ncbi:MAG: ethanolamine ammonia-lyase subunit EutC [Pseudomonadota bacterium]
MDQPKPTLIDNPWQALRRFTDARIAQGRSGVSAPTAAVLAFQLDHARARDAVHQGLDTAALAATLAASGHASVVLSSAAPNRHTYLQRPDLGRTLAPGARAILQARPPVPGGVDLAIVIADGLSARAVAQGAPPLIDALLAQPAIASWSLAPCVIVTGGRVAIGDDIGALLGARALLVLIGERPGLSSPDSMGAYLTWAPRVGRSDAERNCVSNIRPAGLACQDAAATLAYLLSQARQRGLSGVALKDESAAPAPPGATSTRNFLLMPPPDL